MRLLSVLAVAALAAGVYHYRRQLGHIREARQERSNRRMAEAVRSASAGKVSDEAIADLGPMQSGIATGR